MQNEFRKCSALHRNVFKEHGCHKPQNPVGDD